MHEGQKCSELEDWMQRAEGMTEAGPSAPVHELPRRLSAMMMACLDSKATWLMSLDHTQYLMKGVLSSAIVPLCWTSKRTTCSRQPHSNPLEALF